MLHGRKLQPRCARARPRALSLPASTSATVQDGLGRADTHRLPYAVVVMLVFSILGPPIPRDLGRPSYIHVSNDGLALSTPMGASDLPSYASSCFSVILYADDRPLRCVDACCWELLLPMSATVSTWTLLRPPTIPIWPTTSLLGDGKKGFSSEIDLVKVKKHHQSWLGPSMFPEAILLIQLWKL